MATLFLLVLAPASMGTTTAIATVMAAPYHGVTTGVSQSWGTAGCGHAVIGKAPFFHANTGMGGFRNNAWAPTCGNPMGSSGTSSAGFSSLVPIRLHHTNSTVVALVNVTAMGHAKIVAGACAMSMASYYSCYQYASASLTGSAWVYDKTSGVTYYSASYWPGIYAYAYSDVYCFAGNCTTYANGSGAISTSSTFALSIYVSGVNPWDHFELGISFGDYTYASEATYSTTMTGGMASAGINMATGGNGADLASITIT